MSFIDPFQLLKIQTANPQNVTDAMVVAAQADLKALLDATPADKILIGGKSIQKVDALELSAAMGDATARQHFWDMRAVSGLIDFLEGGECPNLTQLLHRSASVGTAFHAFASHWLAKRLDFLAGQALQAMKWIEAGNFVRASAKLHPLSENLALVTTCDFFLRLKMALDQRLFGSVSRLLEEELKPFYVPAILGVINSLPASCQSLRDAYADSLGTLAMRTAQEQKGEPWTYTVAASVAKIKVSPAMAQKLRFIQEKVKDDSGIVQHEIRENRKARIASIVGGLSITVFIILKIILEFLL